MNSYPNSESNAHLQYELSYSLIGYGNVGSWTGRRYCKQKSVHCRHGSRRYFKSEGIDAEQLARYVETTGGIVNYPAASAISQEQFYQTQVDLLIPAALEQMVTIGEAQQINCRVW